MVVQCAALPRQNSCGKLVPSNDVWWYRVLHYIHYQLCFWNIYDQFINLTTSFIKVAFGGAGCCTTSTISTTRSTPCPPLLGWPSTPWMASCRYAITHLFFHSFVHAFICACIHLCIHSFGRSFVRSFVRSFIRSPIHPSTHPSIQLFVRAIYPFTCSVICSFIHSFICSFVCSFIHSLILLLIHSFMYLFCL